MNKKDGRCLKKYYCKLCHRQISINSGIYGSGLCRSCVQKERFKKQKPYNYNKQKRICKQCGKIELVSPACSYRPFCSQKCYGKWLKKYPTNTPKYKDGRALKKDYKKDYMKNRRCVDINFKLLGNLRGRIWCALKGICKSKKTKELLGCSIKKFRIYIQSKFTKGMSWDNYGAWHIDHIIPCARFDFSKISEQKKCFRYTNLQPLWAKDNFIKNKY